jgi:hypothetical protein
MLFGTARDISEGTLRDDAAVIVVERGRGEMINPCV